MKGLFDRRLKSIHKRNILNDIPHSKIYYYNLGIEKILERLNSIVGKQFRNACYIGQMSHCFLETLRQHNPWNIQALTIIDSCKESLNFSIQEISKVPIKIKVVPLCLDEEQ